MVVPAALCATSLTESNGAPLQLRVTCANNRCSMGLDLEQYGGLVKEGITIEFKTKGTTSQIEGVKFSKNGCSFSGSEVDKQFSYSKIDFALRQNSCVAQQPDTRVTPIQPQLTQQKSAPADLESYDSGLGGLFDDLLAPNPANDAEEDEFRRRMQRKKKRQRRI